MIMIAQEFINEVSKLYQDTFGEEIPHTGISLATFIASGIRAIEAYTNRTFDATQPIFKTILVYWMYEALHPFESEKIGDYSYKKGDNQISWKFLADGISDVGW